MNPHRFLLLVVAMGAVTFAGGRIACGDPVSGMTRAPLPAGPLLNPGADFCAWEMDYTYPFDAASKQSAGGASSAPHIMALPRRVVFTRTKTLWHGVITDTEGGTIDEWFDGMFCYVVAKGQPPMISSAALGRQFPTLGKSGFPDMGWISPAAYLGMQTTGGGSCMVFSRQGTTAWVDAQSRFPVQWQRGQEIRSFHPLPPPSDLLVLPAALAKISLEFQRDRELLRRPIPH